MTFYDDHNQKVIHSFMLCLPDLMGRVLAHKDFEERAVVLETSAKALLKPAYLSIH